MKEIKVTTTPVPPPNPFEVPLPTLKNLEIALADLAEAGAAAMKWLADRGHEASHADRAELIRLEIAIADLLFALLPRPSP